MTVVQPRDPNHPLYKLIDDVLETGDIKAIACRIPANNKRGHVTFGAVSRVKCGRERSSRIWKEIVKTALKRKKDQDEIMEILKGSKQKSELIKQ